MINIIPSMRVTIIIVNKVILGVVRDMGGGFHFPVAHTMEGYFFRGLKKEQG